MGVMIRGNSDPHTVVFRVQRADKIRLIPRPSEFMEAAGEIASAVKEGPKPGLKQIGEFWKVGI